MKPVTFSPTQLARVLRAANKSGDKLILRVGRFNGVFFCKTSDQSFIEKAFK